MSEIDDPLVAELVVIELEDLDGRVHLWVKCSRNELATERRDSVVEQL